jgi:hypothetical protein
VLVKMGHEEYYVDVAFLGYTEHIEVQVALLK